MTHQPNAPKIALTNRSSKVDNCKVVIEDILKILLNDIEGYDSYHEQLILNKTLLTNRLIFDGS